MSSFMDQLNHLFRENLDMVTEDHPEKEFGEQVEMAKNLTIDDVTQKVVRIAGSHDAHHQEAVMQHTDPSRNMMLGIGQQEGESDSLATLKRLVNEFEALQYRYREFGASDTEPDAVFHSILGTTKQKVPTDARGWQLYTSSMDCTEAADALTAKANEIVAFIRNVPACDRQAVRKYLKEYCWRV